MDNEQCIRNQNGEIVAWLVGMSEEEIEAWFKKYPDTYLSVEFFD